MAHYYQVTLMFYLYRFILDNKDIVKDKNVLDIGSGSGACAVAAVKSGAKIVVANDIDIASIRAIKINSKLNNVKVLVCNSNLIGKNIDDLNALYGNKPETPKWDVILIGDMFYDSDFSINLFHWLIELVRQEKTILIGDPGRHGLNALNCMNKVGQLIKIAEYNFENIEHYGFPNAAVYKVKKKKNFYSVILLHNITLFILNFFLLKIFFTFILLSVSFFFFSYNSC